MLKYSTSDLHNSSMLACNRLFFKFTSLSFGWLEAAVVLDKFELLEVDESDSLTFDVIGASFYHML